MNFVNCKLNSFFAILGTVFRNVFEVSKLHVCECADNRSLRRTSLAQQKFSRKINAEI